MDNIIIIGIAAYLILRSQFQKVKYFPAGIRFNSITPFAISADLLIRVDNNSDIPLSAKSFSGSLSFQGQQIGLVNIKDPVLIPSFGSNTVTLSANITTTGILQSIINIGSGQSIKLSGRLYFENFSLPINSSFQI